MSAIQPAVPVSQHRLPAGDSLFGSRNNAALVAVFFMLTGVGSVAAALNHVRSEPSKTSGFTVPAPEQQPKATQDNSAGTPAETPRSPLNVNLQSDQGGSTATVNDTSTHVGTNESLTKDYTAGNDGNTSVHISMQNSTSADGASSTQHSSVRIQSSTSSQDKGGTSSQSEEP